MSIEWNRAHPKEILEATRRWRKRNPERTKQLMREWRERNTEAVAKYNRKYRKIHKEELSAAQKEDRKLNPVKYKARKLAQRRVRSGQIMRPTVCSSCEMVGVKIEGHHVNYMKPAELTWLCRKCHARVLVDK